MNIQKASFDFKFRTNLFRLHMNYELPNLVYTDEFRPATRRRNKSAVNCNLIDTDQFTDDIDFLLTSLEKHSVFSKKALLDALIDRCMRHLHESNRLSISDLYLYIDEIVIIIDRWQHQEFNPLAVFEINEYWEGFNINAQRVLNENQLMLSDNGFFELQETSNKIDPKIYDLAEYLLDDLMWHFTGLGQIPLGLIAVLKESVVKPEILINKENAPFMFIKKINESPGASLLKASTLLWNGIYSCEISKFAAENYESEEHVLTAIIELDFRGSYTSRVTKVYGRPI